MRRHRQCHRVWVKVVAAAVVGLLVGDAAAAAAAAAQDSGRRVGPLLPDPPPAQRQQLPAADPGIHVAPNPAAANVPAEMLRALRRDLKVTEAQAKARLVRADWASRLDKPLRQRLGSAFAGSWLTDDGQEFVVAITDPSQERLVLASGATPRLVARSEKQLSAIGARLDARVKDPARWPKGVVGWVVNPQSNQVTVQVRPGGRAAAEAFVAAAGLRPEQVAYQVDTSQVRSWAGPADVEGGDEYRLESRGRCSVGFAVTNDLGNAAFLSAAHCFSDESTPNVYVRIPVAPPVDVRIGTLRRTVTGPEHDEAVVTTIPPILPVPRVSGHGQADIRVSDANEQPAGSPVCISGARSGLVCGTIRPGEFTRTLENGRVIQRYRASNTCGGPGDSGGSVISGNHAQGLISAGPFPCPWFSSNRFTYYVPLQRALSATGSVLRVSAAPAPPPTPPTPSTAWTSAGRSWDGLGGAVKGNVAPVSLSAGHLQLFARGTDDRLYTNTSADGAWSGWQGLGDVVTEPPTVLARSGGIDVYYRGGDTRPYLRRWNGSAWEPAVRLGDIDVEGQMAAVSPRPGQVLLFAREPDDELKVNSYDGSAWSGWLDLGGDINAAPSAIVRPNAAGQPVVEVYARWADDNVRYRRLDPVAGWQSWVNLGGIWKDTPVAVTIGTDQSFLIGWARDDTVHFQRWKNGDWLRGSDGSINAGWQGLGGNAQSQPTAVAGPGEQLRVFARNANQRINMIVWPGWNDLHWESWVPLDGDTNQPVGVSQRNGAPFGMVDAIGVDVATLQPFHTMLGAPQPAPHVAISETDFHVGEPVFLTVTGPPGAPVYWTSTLNGNPNENHTSYGQHLDSDGKLVVPLQRSSDPGGWPGSWTRQVQVGTLAEPSAPISYTVAWQPVAVDVDKTAFQVGDEVTFVVTGPPLQVRWSSTVNGQPSGETDAYYGHVINVTDGVFTLTTRWTDTRVGTWVKRVNVGGVTAEVTFEVSGPPPPPPPDFKEQAMAAVSASDNRMHVVGQTQDGRFFAREQLAPEGGGWSSWYPMGGFVFTAPPTVVANQSGQVEVYGVGTDHAVYRNVHTGAGPDGWSGWMLVNSCCINGKVSVAKDKFNRLNVFGLGTDNAAYVTRQTAPGSNTWTGWAGLGGSLTSPPQAVGFTWNNLSFYYIFVAATGTDGNVHVSVIEDPDANTRTYGAWQNISGGPVAGLSVVGTPFGGGSTVRPFAFFIRRADDNRIYYWEDSAAVWKSLGDNTFTGLPVGVSGSTSSYLYVMGREPSGQILFNRQTCLPIILPCLSAAWSGWSSMGSGTLIAEPAAARYFSGFNLDRLQAFGLGPGRQPVINNQSQQYTSSWGGWSQGW